MLVSVSAECFMSGSDLSDSPLCLSFLVFPETDQLRHAEGKPFPHLLCHSSLLLHGFSFVFVFYFHPSALNNLRAGSSFGPLRVWEHSPAPSPNSWSLHRNVPDSVHTPMSCKIVLRKLPNEVAREFELDLGTGEMQCGDQTRVLKIVHLTSQWLLLTFLKARNSTQTKHLFLNSVA